MSSVTSSSTKMSGPLPNMKLCLKKNSYFHRMYLSNPNYLQLAFQPIYQLRIFFTNRDANENINFVQNILASVKTGSLIQDKISRRWPGNVSSIEELICTRTHGLSMPRPKKSSIRKKIMTHQWGQLLRTYLNSLLYFLPWGWDQAAQILGVQEYLREQTSRRRNQGYQGDKQFRPRYQNFNLVEQRGTNQSQQSMWYPQQQQGIQNTNSNRGINRLTARISEEDPSILLPLSFWVRAFRSLGNLIRILQLHQHNTATEKRFCRQDKDL